MKTKTVHTIRLDSELEAILQEQYAATGTCWKMSTFVRSLFVRGLQEMAGEIAANRNGVVSLIGFTKPIKEIAEPLPQAVNDTWTGYYTGIERRSNVLYPKWG